MAVCVGIWRRGLRLCSVPSMLFPYLPRLVLGWNSDSRELQLARQKIPLLFKCTVKHLTTRWRGAAPAMAGGQG